MSWNFTRILRENAAKRREKLISQEKVAGIKAAGQIEAAKISKPAPKKQPFTSKVVPPIGGPEMERAKLVAKTARERLTAETGMERRRLHHEMGESLATQDIEKRKAKIRERKLMLYGPEGTGGGADTGTGDWDEYDF